MPQELTRRRTFAKDAELFFTAWNRVSGCRQDEVLCRDVVLFGERAGGRIHLIDAGDEAADFADSACLHLAFVAVSALRGLLRLRGFELSAAFASWTFSGCRCGGCRGGRFKLTEEVS